MARKINIMLILVLGVTPSWGKSLLNISDPTDVDYQNIINPSAPQSLKPIATIDISEVMLLQPIEPKSNQAQREHLAIRILERDHKAKAHKYGLNPTPSNKGNSSEPEKQYAWYTDDQLLSEKEAPNVGKDMEGYTNSRRSHRPGTYAKLVNSIVRNLGSSIRMVGAHYWIVSGAG